MTREDIHKNLLDIAKDNSNIILEWATGLGKSFAAIKLQEELNPDMTYIVVAEVAHIKNWELEYKKHGKEELLKKTKIFCYSSLKKFQDEEVGLLILDEGHRATSELRLDLFSTFQVSTVVVLSATISEDKKSLLSETFNRKFEEYKISLNQAIDWGIIPKPKVYIIPLELNKDRYDQIIEINRGKSTKAKLVKTRYEHRFKYLRDKQNYPDLKLVLECTEYQKNLYFEEQLRYYKSVSTNKWLQLGSQRKRFLAGCKTKYAKIMLERLKDYRYICFCGTIEQANELGENVVHSKVKKVLSIIDDFNDKKIDNLIVVNMLQMGQNLVDIDAGLIVQLDGQEISFIQRSGRVLRGAEPIIFIMYLKDTRDEVYLENIKQDINPEHIEIVTDIKNFNF